MLLHDIKKSTGLKKKSKIVGRGNGSGKGNYSTRGLKGQGSRSGGGVPHWFEGGQTPLTLRLPKLKGFKRFFKHIKNIELVNLGDLQTDDMIVAGTQITKELLKKSGYIKKLGLVKVLSKGEFSKNLTFTGIDSFSATAKSQIEKAGGKIEA